MEIIEDLKIKLVFGFEMTDVTLVALEKGSKPLYSIGLKMDF